ncbi:gem-associated protein 2-like [Uloborus diversus]|uniref:gem-associated protein 2-like n=1 Tax=Uloborus diversus TaxID=327109 RepID=UPI002409B46F|nr:gem-associated protein 2-like [Uloborus diversus]
MNEKGKRAFDMWEVPENIDLNAPPVSGFDYLYRVRLETRKCPKVVVANIDTTKFIHRRTQSVDFHSGFTPAPPGLEPDTEWQKGELELFEKYRTQLFKNRALLKRKFAKRNSPNINKSAEWCLYCLGYEKYNGIYKKIDPESDCSSDVPAKKKPCLDLGNRPLLSILLYLNQRSVKKLVSYHTSWLKEIGISKEQGEWIYALLMCLEKPLDPDTCDVLRNLSKLCSSLRLGLLNPQDEMLISLNIIITIIAQCFDQKDLSDTFFKTESSNI